MDRELSALGQLLEDARARVGDTGISIREAARRSGITEARWRQVVRGRQPGRGGAVLPANPKPATVVAMALGVDTDPAAALAAAGLDADLATVTRLVAAHHRATETAEPMDDQLAAEVERIAAMDGVSMENRLRMIRALRDAWENQRPGSGRQETA